MAIFAVVANAMDTVAKILRRPFELMISSIFRLWYVFFLVQC
jgi:hypothetical protein